MKQIIDLVSEKDLRRLTPPANIRLGKEIVASGGVEVAESDPYKVIAKVQPQGGQKHTVELSSTSHGLRTLPGSPAGI